MVDQGEGKLARLNRLRREMIDASEAYDKEIIRLARQDVPQEDIAAAAGLTRNQVRLRERAAGLPPRRPGKIGGRIEDPDLPHAA